MKMKVYFVISYLSVSVLCYNFWLRDLIYILLGYCELSIVYVGLGKFLLAIVEYLDMEFFVMENIKNIF